MSFDKDGKVIGRQMSNVAPPPKQEEFPPPPPGPTRQKIQIVKSADGKIHVRGLLPGQQLVQLPDGKLQIFAVPHGAEFSPPGKVITSMQLPLKSIPSQEQLCSLPDTVLENVFLFLSYDTIAKLRRVNKRFDVICKSLLNKGFRIAQRNVSNSLQQAKSKLPRRDSERDSHHMLNEYGILTDINLEIAWLNIKFEKFINGHFCCFIPGKVLDEIFIILGTLREQEDATRPYSILDALKDLSMELEYLQENIAPSFRKEQAHVDIPLKFPAEEADTGSDKGGDGPVADIRENKEAIRACSRRLLKLTKEKKQMKMQLKNVAMKMKQQKANFKATMKQQKDNFEAIMNEMNLKIEQLDRKVKNQEAVNTDQQAALGVKDPSLNELQEELSEPDVSNGNEGIHSIDKKFIKVKDADADKIIDGNVFEVSQTRETRGSKRKREDFYL